VLARRDWVEKNKETTQKVVNALVETMHWIHDHSAADIADKLPKDFVQNKLSTKEEYVAALEKDKEQFDADGMMPKGGPEAVAALQKASGKLKVDVDLSKTYTDEFAIAANKLLGAAK
jgi:NitT/TauT family transport system substrate-binding protein